MTRGDLVTSRRWQAGKQTYKQRNCETGSDAWRGVGQSNSTNEAMGNHVPPRMERLEAADPAIRSAVQQTDAERPIKRIMSNSFGFGGNNASIILGTEW